MTIAMTNVMFLAVMIFLMAALLCTFVVATRHGAGVLSNVAFLLMMLAVLVVTAVGIWEYGVALL